MSMFCGIVTGDQILPLVALVGGRLVGTAGIEGAGAEGVVLLPALGGELLYGDPGLELEGGGDLLPDLGVEILGRVFGVSLPFCCCLHLARRFLNQT